MAGAEVEFVHLSDPHLTALPLSWGQVRDQVRDPVPDLTPSG